MMFHDDNAMLSLAIQYNYNYIFGDLKSVLDEIHSCSKNSMLFSVSY